MSRMCEIRQRSFIFNSTAWWRRNDVRQQVDKCRRDCDKIVLRLRRPSEIFDFFDKTRLTLITLATDITKCGSRFAYRWRLWNSNTILKSSRASGLVISIAVSVWFHSRSRSTIFLYLSVTMQSNFLARQPLPSFISELFPNIEYEVIWFNRIQLMTEFDDKINLVKFYFHRTFDK